MSIARLPAAQDQLARPARRLPVDAAAPPAAPAPVARLIGGAGHGSPTPRATARPPNQLAILQLQRTVGNWQSQRLLRAQAIQPELTANPLDNGYVREADQVGTMMMGMTEPGSSHGAPLVRQVASIGIQRLCPQCDVELHRPSNRGRPVRIERLCPQCQQRLRQQHTEEALPEGAAASNQSQSLSLRRMYPSCEQELPRQPGEQQEAATTLQATSNPIPLSEGASMLGSTIQRLEGPCEDVAVIPHPLIVRGSVHPAVREAQTKLNSFHDQRVKDGKPGLTDAPLVPDCIFGGATFNATKSFQEIVFPGQREEHDGAIGDKTWAELDKTGGTPAPPTVPPAKPPPLDERAVMDAAGSSARASVASALVKLSALELTIQLGADLSILGLASIHQPTIDAVEKILKVKSTDANFADVVQKALKLMSANVAASGAIQHSCNKQGGDLAFVLVSDIGNGSGQINTCDSFFTKGPLCQRNIIMHERFHLAGCHHGEDKAGNSTTSATRTTEQSLDSADDMNDLVHVIEQETNLNPCAGAA
jgi:hypothetical protein